MKKEVAVVLLIFIMQACDLFTRNDYQTLIPENTPYIVGILEATEDTVQHYSEVYVGYLSQPKGFNGAEEYDWKIKGIWWPVTNVQVTRPATRMNFKLKPDTKATVVIRGPLNTPKETEVHFKHIGHGVYGDVDYKLTLEGGEKYKLSVKMSDGRKYSAITQIPELFEWEVPDKYVMELELKKDVWGVYFEQEKQSLKLPFTVSPNTEYITYQTNSQYDYHNFKTPKGGFLFDDRSNYLRFGAAYGIFDASDQPQIKAIPIVWFEYYDDTPIRQSMEWWLTLNQLNKPLSKFYYSVFPRFASSDSGREDRQDLARVRVLRDKDSSYLFEYMSNIKKVGKNGEMLPKSDAVGVFGAYSAAYKRLTVIPKRSWDPYTIKRKSNK